MSDWRCTWASVSEPPSVLSLVLGEETYAWANERVTIDSEGRQVEVFGVDTRRTAKMVHLPIYHQTVQSNPVSRER
jgi:hypothetical protein